MTASTSNPRTDLHALLIGVSDYPAMPDKALPGARGDVIVWRELLQTMGVADHRIWSAAEVPHTNLAGVEGILTQLVERLQTDTTNRLLVVWGGHGQQCTSGELALATSDTAAFGDGFGPTLSYTRLMDILDGRPAEVELTLVLDTCFAGAGPDHRALTQGGGPVNWPNRRRPTDLVVSASTSGQKSFDLNVHGRATGALSWAATAVLERWGVSSTGAQVALSLDDLRDRVGALLTAMAVDQTPHVDGPETGFRFMHSGHEQAGSGAPQALPGQEIDPGSAGGMVFDLVSGGTTWGQIVSTASDIATKLPKLAGFFAPNHLYLLDFALSDLQQHLANKASFDLLNAKNLVDDQSVYTGRVGDTFASQGVDDYKPRVIEGPCWKISDASNVTGFLCISGTDLWFYLSASAGAGSSARLVQNKDHFEYDALNGEHDLHLAIDKRVS